MQQVYAKRKQKKAALIPRDIDPLRLFAWKLIGSF
jgi:hypothetical protein